MLRPLPLLLVAALAVAVDEDYRATPAESQTPMLGIEMTPVPSHVQEREGLTPHQGVLVQSTYPGTAAEGMGLQRGDVVLSVNDAPIGSMTDLRNEVGLTNVGDPIKVVVSRNGQQLEVGSSVREWPESIPREKIDAAGERRFRDWQDRRQRKQEEDLRRIAREAEDLRRQLAGEGAADRSGKRGKSGAGTGAGSSHGFEMPAVRFSFRIAVNDATVDLAQAAEVTDVPAVTLPAGLPADMPWKLSARLTTL